MGADDSECDAPTGRAPIAPGRISGLYCDTLATQEPRWSRIGPSLKFATIAAPSRSAPSVNATKFRHMTPCLARLQRLFLIAECLIHMTARASRSAIGGKRSDEVAADDDRRVMAAVARHVHVVAFT